MKHGTTNAYNRHGCRCQACVRVWNERSAATMRRIHAEERAKRLAVEAVGGVYVTDRPVTHGNRGTYLTYNCRCGPCHEASLAYTREYRRRREEPS